MLSFRYCEKVEGKVANRGYWRPNSWKRWRNGSQ